MRRSKEMMRPMEQVISGGYTLHVMEAARETDKC